MDADGSNVRNLTKANDEGYSEHPQWSPDGDTIYFQSDADSVSQCDADQVDSGCRARTARA